MPHTVIIADDEPLIRMDIADLLQNSGYQVVGQAADGFDAIDLAQKHHPELVLMDINMPVFDGLSAAQTILKKQLAEAVILLTAHADAALIEKAKEIGVAGYLLKPIQTNSILPTIEIALAQSKRVANLEKREQTMIKKVQDQQLIHRAKAVIARHHNIKEHEALAWMQKESMNKRCALTLFAQTILDTYVDDDTIRLAKEKLMRQYNLSDKAAYQRLKALSVQNKESIAVTAKKLLFAEA